MLLYMYANLYYLYRRVIMPYTPASGSIYWNKTDHNLSSAEPNVTAAIDSTLIHKHGKSIYCCRFIGKIKSNYDIIVM